MHRGIPLNKRNAEGLSDFENFGHWKFSIGHSTFFASICRKKSNYFRNHKGIKIPLRLSLAKEQERDLG
jgi:hypothetical protein